MPAPPDLIDFDDFRDDTTKYATTLCCFERERGRGRMAAIDIWLRPLTDQWDTLTEQEKMNYLCHLIVACKGWLDDHDGDARGITTTRKPHVQTLLSSAIQWYKYLLYEVRKESVMTAAQNQVMVDGQQKYAKLPTKALHGGYIHERDRAKGQDRPAASIVKVYIPGAVANNTVQHTSLHTLTAQEYAAVELIAEQAADNATPRMAYLSKLERLGKMLLVEDGKLMTDPVTPLHCSIPFAYAIDRYGNMYANRNRDGLFHHSSFCRGQQVVCAGCILVEQGSLRHIDNASGHYCPTPQNVHDALTLLDEYGLDMTASQLLLVDPPPLHSQCATHGAACPRPNTLVRQRTFNSADAFRLNINAAANVTTVTCTG